MIINKEVTKSEIIDAPASAVWKALTDKELIRQYFFGTNAESDWENGSAITFTGQWEGQEYTDKGKITDIQKEKLLVFDYWSSMSGLEDKPENYATVSYRLDSAGKDNTKITVTQQGFKDDEAYEHSAEGWKEVLRNLKKVVEE